MTRADLGQDAARELAENGGIATREWICSLLDRAIAVGHTETTRQSNWPDLLDMECHMPVVQLP
jgi:hypothetical protein